MSSYSANALLNAGPRKEYDELVLQHGFPAVDAYKNVVRRYKDVLYRKYAFSLRKGQFMPLDKRMPIISFPQSDVSLYLHYYSMDVRHLFHLLFQSDREISFAVEQHNATNDSEILLQPTLPVITVAAGDASIVDLARTTRSSVKALKADEQPPYDNEDRDSGNNEGKESGQGGAAGQGGNGGGKDGDDMLSLLLLKLDVVNGDEPTVTSALVSLVLGNGLQDDLKLFSIICLFPRKPRKQQRILRLKA